ncbi:MAG: hypothetical protein GKC04_04960 [Methanomicrobiales archaeon]|nr:hypothetical protein [Methanomicrobiales archaeon]
MQREEALAEIGFTGAEQQLARRLALPADACIPLFFSIRFGGAWSFADGGIRALSVVERTTVYDETTGEGYSREVIHLCINPVCTGREGIVRRLEKCGEEKTRFLVERPFRIRIRADRIITAELNPARKTIITRERSSRTIAWEGSAAAQADHELEHLAGRTVAGGLLWEFQFL